MREKTFTQMVQVEFISEIIFSKIKTDLMLFQIKQIILIKYQFLRIQFLKNHFKILSAAYAYNTNEILKNFFPFFVNNLLDFNLITDVI